MNPLLDINDVPFVVSRRTARRIEHNVLHMTTVPIYSGLTQRRVVLLFVFLLLSLLAWRAFVIDSETAWAPGSAEGLVNLLPAQ